MNWNKYYTSQVAKTKRISKWQHTFIGLFSGIGLHVHSDNSNNSTWSFGHLSEKRNVWSEKVIKESEGQKLEVGLNL